MKKLLLITSSIAAAALVSAGVQAGEVKKDKHMDFESFDTDKDGVISFDEFKAAKKGNEVTEAKLKEKFDNFDANKDGKLTKAEKEAVKDKHEGAKAAE